MSEIERESIIYDGAGQNHSVARSELKGLHEPDISKQAYFDRLDEINDTWGSIFDYMTGYEFETAVVNKQHIGENAILFLSTDFSSLTQNIGNAIELAANGAEKPNTAIIYVAFPGNGKSASISGVDRQHFINTGRFTMGEHTHHRYEPLNIAAAAARAVAWQYGKPEHISADVNGARFGLGVMAALPKDSISDAYFNGISGISPNAHYASSMLREDLAGRRERHARGEEYVPGEVTKASIREAKTHLDNIYEGWDHKALWLKTYIRAAVNAPTNLMAFKGHNDLGRLEDHAVFQDTVAALVRQEAMIRMQFNRESSLHSIDDCIRFGKLVMDNIPIELQSEDRGLELIIGTGSLDEHTLNPAGRLATERYGLRSIARFMRLVLSGDGSNITELPAEEIEVKAA